MKPFEEVQYIRNKEDERKLIQDLVEKRGMSRQQAKKILNRQLSNKIFKNDVYQVAIEETKALTDKVDIKMIHLSIKRLVLIDSLFEIGEIFNKLKMNWLVRNVKELNSIQLNQDWLI
jgi:hypothetical protein